MFAVALAALLRADGALAAEPGDGGAQVSLTVLAPDTPAFFVWSKGGLAYDAAEYNSADERLWSLLAEVRCPQSVSQDPSVYSAPDVIAGTRFDDSPFTEFPVSEGPEREETARTFERRPSLSGVFAEDPIVALDALETKAIVACNQALESDRVSSRRLPAALRKTRSLFLQNDGDEATRVSPQIFRARCESNQYQNSGGVWLYRNTRLTEWRAVLDSIPIAVQCGSAPSAGPEKSSAPVLAIQAEPMAVEGRCPLSIILRGSVNNIDADDAQFRFRDDRGRSVTPSKILKSRDGSAAMAFARVGFDGAPDTSETRGVAFEAVGKSGKTSRSDSVKLRFRCVGGFDLPGAELGR